MDAVDLVSDITAQAKDVAQKYSKIKAEESYNALSDDEKAKLKDNAKAQLEKQGKNPSDGEILNQVISQLTQDKGIGNMGDSFSKGLDAASSIITGIITGDLTGGLAGASAQYLAEQIKKQTTNADGSVNKEANLIAHAILGGAVAAAQGNSALAGSTGALTGEAAAGYIKDLLYGEGTNIADLTQEQKENISNLAQIASGLAVAAGGGSVSDVGTSVAGSKNAVENNELNGFGPVIGINNADGANLDSIQHGYANGYLTQEQAIQAAKDQFTGQGLNAQAIELVGLWMRAPEQTGQLLPGPLSAAMALLATVDVALTWTDKADLVSVLNTASKGWVSGNIDSESMTQLNYMTQKLRVNASPAYNSINLFESANQSINEQGLTAAARAWEKYAGRDGGTFTQLKGNVAQKNEAANQFVFEVLTNKNHTKTELSRGGVEYRLQDGRGIRYNADGSFSGFLDPKRNN